MKKISKDKCLYSTWEGIKQRCLNPNNTKYNSYGGRGIEICERWLKYENFFDDMFPTYEKGLQLDRIDNDGDYEPENCRWITRIGQQRNKRTNLTVKFSDEDIFNIYDLYHEGVTLKKISTIYKSPAHILCGIVRGVEAVKEFIRKSYDFDSISLVPQQNICKSRLDTNLKSEVIKGLIVNMPLIASNMPSVCDSNFCIKLEKLGSLGVLPRTFNLEFRFSEVRKVAKECEWIATSIGIDDRFEDVKELISNGANIIFLDVANCYSNYVISFARQIKKEFSDIKLVLGDTTNPGIIYKADFVDALKIGIGPGFVCSTFDVTGFTEGQFSAVLKFKKLSKEFGIPIISDGGTKKPADFIKALAAGANSVMAGKIFAECSDSAGEWITENGEKKKIHAGLSSKYIQEKWKGKLKEGTSPEGRVEHLHITGSVKDLLNYYSGALRSGLTYGGAKDIIGLQEKAKFVEVTRNYWK